MHELESHEILTSLAAIIGLGIGAQWLAWRLRLPSILLLLIFGILAGPIWRHLDPGSSGLLDPETLLGAGLLPIASLSVAVILFEGGLTLRVSELREIGKTVRNLIVLGGLVTWGLITLAAYWILDFDLKLSILFGALMIVTGPTVVLPLLRHVQPVGHVRSLLKWEGILNDPVGAIIAVLVFEGLFLVSDGSVAAHTAMGIVRTLVIGGIFGSIGALILLLLLRKYWIPDFLHSAVSLTLVVVTFTASNLVQTESGLFTVTLMGLILANQKSIPVKHIVEFKENLRVLLISALFIILAARLKIEALQKEFDLAGLGFLAFLILIVRPVAVFLSSIRSNLHWQDRVFVSWMAPRGVVAAAVASLFALRLQEMGSPDAERLVPVTFLVIIGTISVYGLTAYPLAIRLGVAKERPQGVLLVGAPSWARALAEVLDAHAIAVVLVDTNHGNIRKARMAGLRTYHGNALSDDAIEDIDLEGIGRMIAVTTNDEANSLAVLHFTEVFGRREVYQLAPEADRPGDVASPVHLRGRVAFGGEAKFSYLNRRLAEGDVFKVTNLTEDFDFDSVRELYGDEVLPLFVITEAGELRVFSADSEIKLEPGQKLVCLVDEIESGTRD